jgi:aspartate oxidase
VNAAARDFDVLIVGSGLAGLSAALHLAPTHRVAELIVRCAQARHESRDLHFSRDHPSLAEPTAPTVLSPRAG